VIAVAFDGTWDWTAVGTLALALATFVSLYFARRALGQAQEQIKLGQKQLEQTQREIELSRREVEEAHRPVLVPVIIAQRSQMIPLPVNMARTSYPLHPFVAEPGKLIVPVQNIGTGPALNVVVSIERLQDDGAPWTGAIEQQTPGKATGIGPGAPVHIEVFYHGWEQRWSFRLTVAYEDLAGKSWVTVGYYIGESKRFEGVDVKEVEGAQAAVG
jgi:hypothetical protein